MTRNTVRRVEVAVPIFDRNIKRRLWDMFNTMLGDDEKGKEQDAEGEYHSRIINENPFDSQKYFFEQAYIEDGKLEEKIS